MDLRVHVDRWGPQLVDIGRGQTALEDGPSGSHLWSLLHRGVSIVLCLFEDAQNREGNIVTRRRDFGTFGGISLDWPGNPRVSVTRHRAS